MEDKNKTLVFDWSEVNLDTYKSVLKQFWDNAEWTRDKVLEVQDTLAIMNQFDLRKYWIIGENTIDWIEYNGDVLISLTENFGETAAERIIADRSLLCEVIVMPGESDSPIRILPVGRCRESDDYEITVGVTEFEEAWEKIMGNQHDIFPWHTVDEAGYKRLYSPLFYETSGIPNTERRIRIRAMDRALWREITTEAINEGESFLWTEDDLDSSEIWPANVEVKEDLEALENLKERIRDMGIDVQP